MSSLPLNAAASSFLPAGLEQKRATVLAHLAHSERLVAVRPASRLEVRPRPEMLATGIPQMDALTGGIPRGCLSEIYGSGSSGKTSMLVAALASATRKGEACVLIDASDCFDPASGATAGIDFKKLLWVRCGGLPKLGIRAVVAHKKAANDQPPTTNGFLFRQKKHEHRLEQVLKATDLILQSGGFGLVALDLAGITDKFIRRIPLASWFRFQRAVEHTKTALLVISEVPCAQTCAALVLKLSAFSWQLSGKLSVAGGQPAETSAVCNPADLVFPLYAPPEPASDCETSREAAAWESPAWQRRVAGQVERESRKGRHPVSF